MDKVFRSTPRYKPLNDDEAALDDISVEEKATTTAKPDYDTKEPRTLLLKKLLYGLLAVFIGLAALDSFTHRIAQIKSRIGAIDKCVCKGPRTLVKARGCIWDDLEVAWVRNSTQCVDFELLEEYSKAGPGPNGEWTYYAIENGQHVNLTVEETSMKLGPDSNIYVTYRQHVTHCIFTWRKLWRSQHLKTGTKELGNNDEHHIKHCGKEMLLRTDLDRIITKVAYTGPKHVAENKKNPYRQANREDGHEHAEDKQY